MNKVIAFPNQEADTLNHRKTNGLFLAIEAEKLNPYDLETISPSFMHWDNNMWILDLSFSTHYWLNEAKKKKLSLFQFLTSLCKQISNQDCFATFADDPWKALILTKSLKNKGIKAIINLSSEQGQNLFKHISWDVWFAACNALIEMKLSKHSLKKSQAHQYQRNLNLLKTYIERLVISTPQDFFAIDTNQIQRRFGPWILKVCEGSKLETSINNMKFSLEDHPFFPWYRYQIRELPQVNRYLEHPLNKWEFIEENLRSDLDKLRFLESFKEDDRIITMEWQVVLHDLEEVSIMIQFRHPYNLHKEAPHYRTALLQILHHFEGWKISYYKTNSHQNFITEPSIISWNISIDAQIQQTKTDYILFESNRDIETLKRIENRILSQLKSYDIYDSWVPEHSYIEIDNHSDGQQPKKQELSTVACHEAYRNRPLYLYQDPQKFEDFDHCYDWLFCERTMSPWWEENDSQNKLSRDYYKVIYQDQHLWSYRNDHGEWLIHGIFT